MDQLYEFGGGGSGSNDSVMQYGSAAGVCRPRDDIRDISRAILEGFLMGCLALKHQAGSGGGETRDNETSTAAAL